MEQTVTKNKTIVKNTLFLYIRMLFAMGINLYASRLLLNTLGIEDYGVYNIVGGIVAIMMFVNTAMQGSTIRFITFSIGKQLKSDIRETVNSSIHIHIWIMILILFLGETIGLWFFNTQLNIPEKSIKAANWVYQLSIFVSCLAIIQVPLNALLISYEKMDVYALIEIINVLLKCSVIFVLPMFYDRLIAYSILLFLVAVVVFLAYFIYCRNRINGYYLNRHLKIATAKPMLSFAMWSLYGNGTYAISQQGTNILINKIFGVAFNAASGVATQASSILSTFVSNIQSAFNPQIIKEYSAGNMQRMHTLISKENEIMLLLASLIFTPLYINMDYIMELWLKNAPPYSSIFCQLLLISNLIQISTNIIAVAIQATGKNKLFSFIIGSINLVCLASVGICFKLGNDAYYAYIMYSLSFLAKLIAEVILINYYVPDLRIFSIMRGSMKPLMVLVISFICSYYLTVNISTNFTRLFTSLIVNAALVVLFVVIFFPLYRSYIKNFAKNKINLRII
ncbi:hypothetical protein [Macellibacteroides fermentans]|uniref:Membrane protein involved in the export of O-antigen and teichoic acid n=1 Tax=Parabacteroides chartae TaxID=1037355 RepID=A0A1T5AN07_9BACT|nr:hypothetical protein [Parabacteroides chartae]SKB36411.1 Membrane protein involved in the export of O-antigen and teichoic acid [Parabacteroides chartae]